MGDFEQDQVSHDGGEGADFGGAEVDGSLFRGEADYAEGDAVGYAVCDDGGEDDVWEGGAGFGGVAA